MKKQSALTVIPAADPVSTVVKPKPTKSEIIEALLVMARRDHVALRERLKKEQLAAFEKFRKLVITHVRKTPKALIEWLQDAPPQAFNLWSSSADNGFRLDWCIKDFTEETKLALIAYQSSKTVSSFDEKEARREIVSRLNGLGAAQSKTERVQALADSPELAALWKSLQ